MLLYTYPSRQNVHRGFMLSEDGPYHEAKTVIVDCGQQFQKDSETLKYFFSSKHSYVQASDMSTLNIDPTLPFSIFVNVNHDSLPFENTMYFSLVISRRIVFSFHFIPTKHSRLWKNIESCLGVFTMTVIDLLRNILPS